MQTEELENGKATLLHVHILVPHEVAHYGMYEFRFLVNIFKKYCFQLYKYSLIYLSSYPLMVSRDSFSTWTWARFHVGGA